MKIYRGVNILRLLLGAISSLEYILFVNKRTKMRFEIVREFFLLLSKFDFVVFRNNIIGVISKYLSAYMREGCNQRMVIFVDPICRVFIIP